MASTDNKKELDNLSRKVEALTQQLAKNERQMQRHADAISKLTDVLKTFKPLKETNE